MDFQDFVEGLEREGREAVASEINVLQSIYGDEALSVWRDDSAHHQSPSGAIRYEVTINLPDPYEDVTMRLLVSLPPTYPSSSPPQLQLLSRYVGAYQADAELFGAILRTYISVNGVEWTEDDVCVFDGVQSVIDRVVVWLQERMGAEKAGALLREDAIGDKEPSVHADEAKEPPRHDDTIEGLSDAHESASMPEGIEIVEAEAITDRKSGFVGRACRISHPSQVPQVLNYLMTDRRISRAAHPTINAWRCQVGTLLHQDNYDDGETAAGGRLAHLLQILEVNNVLVVVTRYYGGIHLGPDRFKHINQAARNALDLGGFLDVPDSKKPVGRVKKH